MSPEIKRDSYLAMMKEGRYRAIRNMPVGWILQVIHSTDTSERIYRLTVEAAMLALLWYFLTSTGIVAQSWQALVLAFIIVHTASWFLFGNFWVYMLDSFLWVRNPGLDGVISYIDDVKSLYDDSNSADAILIYGSMCRNMLHIRSDLDLRVVRKPGLMAAIVCCTLAARAKIVAFFKIMPVDFQVVDSMDFLKEQMRSDEKPIIVFQDKQFILGVGGREYKEIQANPMIVLRENNEQL